MWLTIEEGGMRRDGLASTGVGDIVALSLFALALGTFLAPSFALPGIGVLASLCRGRLGIGRGKLAAGAIGENMAFE